MSKEMKAWINSDHKMSSMFASICGSVKVLLGERCGDPSIAKGQDMQEVIESAIMNVIASVRPDLTSWPYKKGSMVYDDYLQYREQQEKITEFDLVRPGLFESNFTNCYKYFEHLTRIMEHRKKLESVTGAGEKQCKKCGNVKSADKFKTGAVCNACRSKIYRANKTQKELDQGRDEYSRKMEAAQRHTGKVWSDPGLPTEGLKHTPEEQ